jgi:diguanylate cyclase (GGDEF)-like protein
MSKTIYIADDESNIRIAIKTFLENAGFHVVDFENGDLLLEAFSQQPADLVILDVMMPGSNGFVVCKAIRKVSRIPIIMLTARDSDLDYATGLDLGSDDYLNKPFSPVALVMRIKAIFRRIEYDRQENNECDPVTGIYNKVSGIGLIENVLGNSDASAIHTLFVLDLDNFRSINDKLGHAWGDKVMTETAQLITKLFKDDDIVCRLGGDEFVVFAKNTMEVGFAAEKANELCNTLRKNYGESNNLCTLSVSIGIACFPLHGQTYDELFRCADRVLAMVKENGKDGFLLYENSASNTP